MKMTYKWLLVALLSCAFFFHQVDRALFGLLTIPIQDELGLTDVQVGWINTVLSWTLAGMVFVDEGRTILSEELREIVRRDFSQFSGYALERYFYWKCRRGDALCPHVLLVGPQGRKRD